MDLQFNGVLYTKRRDINHFHFFNTKNDCTYVMRDELPTYENDGMDYEKLFVFKVDANGYVYDRTGRIGQFNTYGSDVKDAWSFNPYDESQPKRTANSTDLLATEKHVFTEMLDELQG